MEEKKHILITGGAGYIGSLLTGELLRLGYRVTVVDTLLFGGESIVSYLPHPNFRFVKSDVVEPRAIKSIDSRDWPRPHGIVHLAAIVGFPACQAVGQQVAWRYNVDATRHVYQQAAEMGVNRMILASTYSNYGFSEDGMPVTEDSPLMPQSLYAETKIAAEEFMRDQKDHPTAPLIYRFATLFGLSPRTRFDLIVNQFVLEALRERKLLIYQRGYSRSFLHVFDAIRGIILGIEAPEEKIRGEIYNVGTDDGNYTKDAIVGLIIKRLAETRVEYKDLTFGGDMRDITVSFEKIRSRLGFNATRTIDDGIREVLHALQDGIIQDPMNTRYRNARFIVQ